MLSQNLIAARWAAKLILIAVFFLIPATLVAQDDQPSLKDLQQQWSELDQKLSEKRDAIESGEGDTQELQDQYRDLMDQASQMLGELRSAALGAIKEDPKDKDALRQLMGILMNDAQQERDKQVLSIGDVLISAGIHPLYFETAAKADRLSISAKEIFEELLIRQREAKADDLPRVNLETTKGDIVLELYENQAPNTVANLISLVEAGYFDDRLFHRVIEGFMAQAGQSKSDGSGTEGPGYDIACECYTPEARPHFSHSLSMAHAGKDTGGGQFFLTFERTDMLDGRHTVFGRVIEGGDVLDQLQRTHISIQGVDQEIPKVEKDKIISAEVIRKREHEYEPTKVGDGEQDSESQPEKPPADPNLSAPVDNEAEKNE